MTARTFASNTNVAAFNNSTATAILEYADAAVRRRRAPPVFLTTTLPTIDDIAATEAYTARLWSLATAAHPVDVLAIADERLLVTVAVNLIPSGGAACGEPQGDRLAASLNNVSFVNPSSVDILSAYYHRRRRHHVYGADYPDESSSRFKFTDLGLPAAGIDPFTERGTRVKVLEHGDPAGYNLIDPLLQNTVSVPKGGWAAICFRATNPGVWFMHCHFDRHVMWGMDTVFIVKDSKTPETKMRRPPSNMPKF